MIFMMVFYFDKIISFRIFIKEKMFYEYFDWDFLRNVIFTN